MHNFNVIVSSLLQHVKERFLLQLHGTIKVPKSLVLQLSALFRKTELYNLHSRK
jgi:hypothetical protein